MRRLPLTAIVGSLALTPTLSADYLGLTAERFVGDGWVCNGFAGLTAWRIYANFDADDPNAGVITAGFPWSMQSTNGLFENASAQYDSLCAPEDLTDVGIWENQWDTYVTIGRDDAEGMGCPLGPDFAKGTNNLASDFDCPGCAYFLTPDDEEARAVDGRVLLGQFTVEEGEVVTGSLSLLLLSGFQVIDEEIVPIDCRSDLDGSDGIGFGDLLVVLGEWGPCDPPCSACAADLSGDRVVGFEDLLIVLAAWGPCP